MSRRVFINASLLRELRDFTTYDERNAFGGGGSVPLYVLMHLRRPINGFVDFDLDEIDAAYVHALELHEITTDEEDLIARLESNPDLFQATSFELEDGTEAVTYDLAAGRIFTMHRVEDEVDWRVVMRTYDPTWIVGPSIPKMRPAKRRRRK